MRGQSGPMRSSLLLGAAVLLLMAAATANGGVPAHGSAASAAHAQLLSAGVRDRDRAVRALGDVEQAYGQIASGLPPGDEALRRQLLQLQQAVRSDLTSLEQQDSTALRAATQQYTALAASTADGGIRRTVLLRLADLYTFFGDWNAAWGVLATWLGIPIPSPRGVDPSFQWQVVADSDPGSGAAADPPLLPTGGLDDSQAANALAAVRLELAGQPGTPASVAVEHVASARFLLERIIRAQPQDLAALVRLAYLHARPPGAGSPVDYPLAVKLLEQARATAEAAEEQSGSPGLLRDPRFWQELGGGYARLNNAVAMGATFEEAAQRGVFPSRWQRPRQTVPGLTAQPFWNVSELHADARFAVERLQDPAVWRAIRAEGLTILQQGQLFSAEPEGLVDASGDSSVGSLAGTGDGPQEAGWSQLVLYDHGEWAGQFCTEWASTTCTVLAEAFGAAGGDGRRLLTASGQAKFSLLWPGTHILPHTGPTNARLRLHLGLHVGGPPGKFVLRVADKPEREWFEGEVLILDDSFEHELWAAAAANASRVSGEPAGARGGAEDEDEDGLLLGRVKDARLILIIDLDHPDL